MASAKFWMAATAVSAAIALAPAALANTAAATHFSSKSLNRNVTPISHTVPRGEVVPNRYIKGSDTANFFYRVGVTKFENGNLDAAERAFKAVLRANGSHKEAHHYLALISGEKGDKAGVIQHVQAFRAEK